MDSAELLDILGNENRRRILRLLSRKPCYVTEISEYLGVSPKAVIDHLRRLEDVGLVESRTDDQRRKYFSIARNLRLEVSVSPYEFGMKSAYPASSNLDVSRWRYVSLDFQTDIDSETSESEITESETNDSETNVAETDDAGTDTPESATAEDQASGEVHADRPKGDKEKAPADSPDDETVESATSLASELDELQQLQRELSLAQRWVHGRIADVQDRLGDALDANGEQRLHAEVLAAVAGESTTTVSVSRSVQAPKHVVEECLSQLEDRGLLERDDDEWTLAE